MFTKEVNKVSKDILNKCVQNYVHIVEDSKNMIIYLQLNVDIMVCLFIYTQSHRHMWTDRENVMPTV